MKKLLPFITIVYLISCNNSNSSYDNPKTAEELRMDLISQEKSAPTEYLEVRANYHENFWGNKLKLHCVINNKATLASFKDAVLKISYYSKTKTEIATKEITVYEIFKPHTYKTVELKIDNFQDVNSLGWEVINAIPVD